jgi:hypothetical protein
VVVREEVAQLKKKVVGRFLAKLLSALDLFRCGDATRIAALLGRLLPMLHLHGRCYCSFVGRCPVRVVYTMAWPNHGLPCHICIVGVSLREIGVGQGNGLRYLVPLLPDGRRLLQSVYVQ